MAKALQPQYKKTIGSLIFLSRWLQAPLYFGLIIAQCIYVYQFMVQLWHLLMLQLPGHEIIQLAANGSPMTPTEIAASSEVQIMLAVLGLIDVVMIANLLIMVIVGGYETFVSRLNLANHPDQPEWLSHVNAGILKVKLATALIGISSIHLLAVFIKAKDTDSRVIMWQIAIHLTFVLSAVVLAWIDRLTVYPKAAAH